MKKKTLPSRSKLKKLTHSTVPATVGLVNKVRDELKSEIQSVGYKINSIDSRMGSIDSRMDSMDSRMDSMDSRMDSMDKRMDSMDKRFDSLDQKIDAVEGRLSSKIEQVMVSVHRTQVLMEEQRAENKIVLDGLKTVLDRQDRVEVDLADLRNTVYTLKDAVK